MMDKKLTDLSFSEIESHIAFLEDRIHDLKFQLAVTRDEFDEYREAVNDNVLTDTITDLETELDQLFAIAGNLFLSCERMEGMLTRYQVGIPAEVATSMRQFVDFVDNTMEDDDGAEADEADSADDRPSGRDQSVDSAPRGGEAESKVDPTTEGPTERSVHAAGDTEL